ncbi:STAS domain-containing protein [bacterium]|nr:STAS domain-containing protein [bacterium]
MRYEHEKVGNIIVVRIQETKLTSHEAPEMKTALLGLIIGEGKQFILNLKEVEYMDSTGLGAFLFGIRQAEHYDKDLVFCAIQPRIQNLIRIAQLDHVIESYDTEEQALKELQTDRDDG